MSFIPALLAAIVVSALSAMVSGSMGPDLAWLHYVSKPLTTVLIMVLAWRGDASSAIYRRLMLVALAFALGGDVALMLPMEQLPNGFVLGLASFLGGHLFFIGALTRGVGLLPRRLPFVILMGLAAGNLMVLWPGLPAGLGAPVLAYMLCLVTMAAQAVSRALVVRTHAAWHAALGGLAFLLSDTLLAYDRFHAPLPAASWLVLGSYYAAIALLASSTWRLPAKVMNMKLMHRSA